MSWEKFWDVVPQLQDAASEPYQALLGIDGMGQAALGSLAEFFAAESNHKIVERLVAHLNIQDAEAPTS
jgi:DNA ligase (NAD+)